MLSFVSYHCPKRSNGKVKVDVPGVVPPNGGAGGITLINMCMHLSCSLLLLLLLRALSSATSWDKIWPTARPHLGTGSCGFC